MKAFVIYYLMCFDVLSSVSGSLELKLQIVVSCWVLGIKPEEQSVLFAEPTLQPYEGILKEPGHLSSVQHKSLECFLLILTRISYRKFVVNLENERKTKS